MITGVSLAVGTNLAALILVLERTGDVVLGETQFVLSMTIVVQDFMSLKL